MISHEHRCIFVHVPRSGGSSIEYVLWPGERGVEHLWMGFVTPLGNGFQTGGLQHLTARLIRGVVGESIFGEYYRFAVVRNPWDKAVSQYAFMQRRADLRTYLGMEEQDEFKRYLELIRTRVHVQWQPQHTFVCDDDGTLLVENILRFESLQHDIGRVFGRLGVYAELPALHAAVRKPLAEYYDDEAQAMVAEYYAEDVRRFGYAFPG